MRAVNTHTHDFASSVEIIGLSCFFFKTNFKLISTSTTNIFTGYKAIGVICARNLGPCYSKAQQ